MNVVRIRHIMEMRRACKAPPLLPPKLKKSSCDNSDRKTAVKDILDIHLSLRNIPSDASTSKSLMCLFYESEGGRNGPWKMINGTDTFPNCSAIDIPDVFSIEYMFERPQPIRVELCEWSENEVTPLGSAYFLISEVVALGVVVRNLNNEGTGAGVGQMSVGSTARPKPPPLLLQFEGKNFSKKFVPDSAVLSFEVVRTEADGEKTMLYKSEPLKNASRVTWKAFTLPIQEISDEARQLEVICYYKDEKYRNSVAGSFITTHYELRTIQEPFTLTNPIYKGGQKVCAQFDVIKRSELTICSFLDYISFGTVLHFAFAIDFSDCEGAQDHESQMNFTNNVEFAIRSVGETFADYNRNNVYTAYGFGARIPPLYRESHEFCLNLETDPTCVGVDGVVTAFRNTYLQTQPCPSAHFAHVIYHIAKIAQITATRSEPNRPQYHILNIITRGAIDDVRETVQAAIFSSKTPISVIFTGIGDRNLDEVERLGAGGKRLIFHGRKTDRDNLHYVNMTRVLLECDGSADESKFTLSEKSLYQIPRQVATYFTKNGILPVERHDTPAHESPLDTVYRASPAPDVDESEPYGRAAIDHGSPEVPVTPVPSYMQESFETIQRRPPALNRSLRSMTITGDAGRRF
uniref:Copine domain-containing protein n=1 Tax=Haemonchus contortus TaxID=6289 RepID=A0A7I4YPB0_HAECO